MANGASSATFELGLVMAGAISGGAYTAGVVDFLVQALDAWAAWKAQSAPDVPPHSVKIRVMSGASAGAMTAAMAAVAVGCDIVPVTDVDAPPPPEQNRLFDSWVKQIDIMKLLGERDLEQFGKVVSLLDATELKAIATGALSGRRRAEPRSYIDDPLAVLLTVANLRGVPYGFHLYGSSPDTLFGMSDHMDDMRFAISRAGNALPGARLLDPATAPGGDWPLLADAALASGAFPLGLQPRLLERPREDYAHVLSRAPSWGEPLPADPYRFLSVDGGLMNNEPLELARRYLSGGPVGTNPRDGDLASRAVILIDPFPNQIEFTRDYVPDNGIVAVFQQMFAALKNQARFKPEELALAEQDDVYSRFMISPSRQDSAGHPVEPAMAAAILGGFGGFFHESFRRHDFQLGRRNCQAFLRRHFCLPESNALFAGMSQEMRNAGYLRNAQGDLEMFEGKDGSRLPFLPIVPLTPELATPVPLPPAPDGGVVDLDRLQRAIEARTQAVGKTLIDTELDTLVGAAIRWSLQQGWRWHMAGRVTAKAMAKIKAELDRL